MHTRKRDTRNIVPLQKNSGFYGANLDEWPGSGSGRRTDEEAQFGNGALALRFIRDGKIFNGMENQQQVNRYRGRIRVNGKTDDTSGRALRDCGIGMAVCCFQSGHKQGKHNAYHRDQAHELTALELTDSSLHGQLR